MTPPRPLSTFQQGCAALAVGFFATTILVELAAWVFRAVAG